MSRPRRSPPSRPELGPTLIGDKAHSVVFDNSKVTALVPEFRTTITFDEGARRIVEHYDAHPDDQQVDASRDALFDRSRPTPAPPADHPEGRTHSEHIARSIGSP